MARVVVRGGLPGFMRVELEGTDLGVDLPLEGNAYQCAHALQDFMQVLADAVPQVDTPAAVGSMLPPARKSKAPPPGDA